MSSAGNGDAPLVEVKNVKKYFPIRKGLLQREVGAVHAVDDVTFAVQEGETLGLVGESGCGKSTLGRTIVRLHEPTEGNVIFEGRDISKLGTRALRPLRREMQMIFQDPYASLNPRKRVGSIIGTPLKIHGVEKSQRRARVQELLETVGLSPEHYNRFPHEFSGGQRQRIGVARALALNPKLVVADEPVSALDVSIQSQMLNLLDDLQKELKLTYIFIAHDLGVVRHVSDRIAVMYLGQARGALAGRGSLPPADPSLQRGPSLRGADPRSGPERAAGADRPPGRRAEPDQSSVRLPLPSPVPLHDGHLQGRRAAAGGLRPRAPGGLPPPPERRPGDARAGEGLEPPYAGGRRRFGQATGFLGPFGSRPGPLARIPPSR